MTERRVRTMGKREKRRERRMKRGKKKKGRGTSSGLCVAATRATYLAGTKTIKWIEISA